MGFEPSRSHPVEVKVAGIKVSLSILSAETLQQEVRALIAEAKLAEAGEYLSFRIRMYEEALAAARATKRTPRSGRKSK
jgi:hypothetical protein